MVLSVLEDAFDTQTIPVSERLFGFLESLADYFEKEGVEGARGVGPILLRICNELLRRLSRVLNTTFCGRIMIFLAKCFPLSDRSGVNLRGEFNVDNVTHIERDHPISNVQDNASNNVEMEAIERQSSEETQSEKKLEDTMVVKEELKDDQMDMDYEEGEADEGKISMSHLTI